MQFEKAPTVMLSQEQLAARVRELGAEITAAYAGKDVTVVGVLSGSFIFMADLVRHIDLPIRCDFLGLSSYGSATESSGVVAITKDLSGPVEGRHILVVEDIVDTGLTLRYLRRSLEARNPASLEVCTLLARESADLEGLGVRYVGFTIPGEFVVGYGLDVDERYRNLRHIAVYVDPSV